MSCLMGQVSGITCTVVVRVMTRTRMRLEVKRVAQIFCHRPDADRTAAQTRTGLCHTSHHKARLKPHCNHLSAARQNRGSSEDMHSRNSLLACLLVASRLRFNHVAKCSAITAVFSFISRSCVHLSSSFPAMCRKRDHARSQPARSRTYTSEPACISAHAKRCYYAVTPVDN